MSTPKNVDGWNFDQGTNENLLKSLESLDSVAQALIYFAKEDQKTEGDLHISRAQLFDYGCTIENHVDGMLEDLGLERPLKIKERFENNRALPILK